MDSNVIVLNENGTADVLPKESLRGKLKKVIPKSDVYGVLMPVGLYSPQYVLFKRNELIDKFVSADITYQVSFYNCGILAYIATEKDYGKTEPVKVHCECLPDLYTSLHSIQKIAGYNLAFTAGLDTPSVLLVSDVSLKIRTSDKDYEFSIHDDGYVMQKLDSFFKDSFGIKSFIPVYELGCPIYINTRTNEWTYRGTKFIAGKRVFITTDKDVLKSVGLIRFNCMTFVPPDDIELVSRYHGKLHVVSFDDVEMLENMGLDGPLRLRDLYQHPEYFAVIEDCDYKLITAADIIEAVMTMRYMLITWQAIHKIKTFDGQENICDGNNVMVTIMLSPEEDKKHDPYDAMEYFEYNATIVEKEDVYIEDYYDEFINELRKYDMPF